MDQLTVGQEFSFRKTMTVAEQAMFTGISGNMGGLYVDALRARAEGADGPVAFELAVGALATTALSRLGGSGRRIGRIAFDFATPVGVGQSVEALARVTALDGGTATCSIEIRRNPDAQIVATGEAVLVPFAGDRADV
ncbi:MaoC/PaaZ C-terminal domain-containing protein [Paracoccus laeviglucosivorans]|uniref:Acyl dehydratase n=1 Tax=Paracoccus laeviglucosivorans TaxID=1197861 RepID=A0A521FKD0_9RHOB|nr:MaoC/PaaZ C-terminal domain-containing protein [Paracoccus laeviglucosivorans]SMO96586.1 Acyl dehydratase [Paracoccus laeviglucosivorans]